MWGLHGLPESVWVSSGESGVLPHPKDVNMGQIVASQLPHLSSVAVCEWLCEGRASCPEWVSPYDPLQEEALATLGTKLE